MKLRNKKTREIVDLSVGHITDTHYGEFIQIKPVACLEDKGSYLYDTFAKFSEDWEDYKPTEPLIKDDKIRKAVRAWAEANGYTKLWVYHDHTTISFYNEDDGDNEITFNTMEKFGLEHLKCYTITELCEEEDE